ncbi:MAG: SRPBCC family protein [Chloroflexaceae bacterium]
MAHVRKSILIHAPVEKVFAFAGDPKNWAAYWVGLGEPEEQTGEGEVGTVVKHSYLMAGVRFPVTSRVLENATGPEGARWRGAIEGPLSGEQTWTYARREGDTEVTADIQYTVPGSVLGRIADRLIIERMQERSIAQTLENLKLLCEAAA